MMQTMPNGTTVEVLPTQLLLTGTTFWGRAVTQEDVTERLRELLLYEVGKQDGLLAKDEADLAMADQEDKVKLSDIHWSRGYHKGKRAAYFDLLYSLGLLGKRGELPTCSPKLTGEMDFS